MQVSKEKTPTIVTEEIASVCGRQVPASGSIEVLGFSADQLSFLQVVWVVVKGAEILTTAHHVLHIWGVVDCGRIRQCTECRGRGFCVCPLVSFNTC